MLQVELAARGVVLGPGGFDVVDVRDCIHLRLQVASTTYYGHLEGVVTPFAKQSYAQQMRLGIQIRGDDAGEHPFVAVQNIFSPRLPPCTGIVEMASCRWPQRAAFG